MLDTGAAPWRISPQLHSSPFLSGGNDYAKFSHRSYEYFYAFPTYVRMCLYVNLVLSYVLLKFIP